jgi:hypothetical protein
VIGADGDPALLERIRLAEWAEEQAEKDARVAWS